MARMKAMWSRWRLAEALAEGALSPVWEAPRADVGRRG
jgi:hypothetical protein